MRRSKRHDAQVPGSGVSTSLLIRRELDAGRRRGPTAEEVYRTPELYGAVKLAQRLHRHMKEMESVENDPA